MSNKEISRREFLTKISKGAAAAAVVPAFFTSNPAVVFGGQYLNKLNSFNRLKTELNQKSILDHFGVTEKMIADVIAEAMSGGGDYCDLYFQHTISNYIGLEDSSVNRAYSDIAFGVGIRVVKGDQTGFSFTEEISLPAMKSAAKTAANIADSPSVYKPVNMSFKNIPGYYEIKTPWEDVGIKDKIPYLQRINEKVFAADKRIIKSNIWFFDETSYVLIATSEGKLIYDYRPMGQVSVSCNAEQNGKREQNYFDLSGRRGIEFLTTENIDLLASESVRRTVELFDAVKPQAGLMPVVLAAGSSGILLHEAIGHGMEADFNRKNISIFSDKIGKKVAENFVSIVDDGTNPNVRGSINVDDEGNDSQKTYLVKDGTMLSYLHDSISAKHYKLDPTGNGRRESFRFAPQPRMRNTYMLPGPHTKEEIIRSVSKGIYAESFTNGEVFIGAGDFTFYVKAGYLIEDGKLTKPIKDINIIGNGPQVLKDIVMVGNDFQMAEGGWTCGKGGQGVPVSMGLPTVKVSGITVGGA